MKSRTSFFHKTVFKKDLIRFAPAWGIYTIFLLLADLVARTILSPIELSIGVVTSLVGAVAFVIIFYRTRKGR